MKRENLDGWMIAATFKPMDTGERRWRLRPTGTKTAAVILTQGEEEPEWQLPHFHRGYTEVYAIVDGYVAFVWRNDRGQIEWTVMKADGTNCSFSPGEAHIVLPAPNAEFITWQVGIAVSNPGRGGNDYWPEDSLLEDAREELRNAEAYLSALLR